MRATAFLSCAVLLAACARGEKAPADTTAATPAPAAAAPAPAAPAPAPPAALALADLAGKWTQQVRRENSDSVIVTAEVVATADPSGWTIKLPGRAVMPLRVTVGGDSLMTASGPYESVLRKGVQVTTSSVLRMQDGKLTGITTAHYKTTAADSVTRLRTEMTRAK